MDGVCRFTDEVTQLKDRSHDNLGFADRENVRSTPSFLCDLCDLLRRFRSAGFTLSFANNNGRAGEIRTHDLLHPMQAFYQAELQPDLWQPGDPG